MNTQLNESLDKAFEAIRTELSLDPLQETDWNELFSDLPDAEDI